MGSTGHRGPRWRHAVVTALATLWLAAAAAPAWADANDNAWPSAGQNTGNTRHQNQRGGLGVSTVPRLSVKRSFTTGGEVSATPAVDATRV